MTKLIYRERFSRMFNWKYLGWAMVVPVIWTCQLPPSQIFPSPGQSQDRADHPLSWPETFGFGREATTQEIDSLSIAIMPDGRGLPIGKGTALKGKPIYMQKCAACHGVNGHDGPFDILVATAPYVPDSVGVKKAIGNYWPYSTTVFDYIRRAMPLDAPGSLSDNEVYNLTAWLLHVNGLIDTAYTVDAATLPQIQMPAHPLFFSMEEFPEINYSSQP